MEVLLPYLTLMGAGIIGANLTCLIWKKISMGVVGNCLTGMLGGIVVSFSLQYLFIYIPNNTMSYFVIGLLAGIVMMIAIGCMRRKTIGAISEG